MTNIQESFEKFISPRTVFMILLVTTVTFDSRHVKKSNSYPKVTIIYWTKVPSWGLGSYKMESCNEQMGTKCVLTNNRSLLPDADALVFRGMDTNVKGFQFPSFRSPAQIWVYVDAEAPGRSWQIRVKLATKFNWTMTYRSSSDIPYPYGFTLLRKTPWSEKEFDTYFNNLIQKKKKLVSWLVSNCNAPSRRKNIVADLSKLVPVDVYGRCGKLKCKETKKSSTCFKSLSDQYKFYLAFENSICYEYVTEKAFNSLREDIVPLVYNGANLSASLPPNSYIDILSYDNLTTLVDYLHELDQNDVLYRKYFEWKRYYEIGQRDPNGWCGLCKKVSEQRLKPQYKTYEDVVQFLHHYEGDKKQAPKFLEKYLKNMSPKVPACNLLENKRN